MVCIHLSSQNNPNVPNVLGHSLGQCDRNLGFMKSGIKNKFVVEKIETYLQNTRKFRENPPSLLCINDTDILLDWKNGLT